MKYLLSWVTKHLAINNWKQILHIEELIEKISNHVAEVSSYKHIKYENLKIHIATIINNNQDLCLAQLNNEEKIIHLTPWKDAISGLRYLIIQTDDNKYRFATMQDFYSENKNHYIGAIYGNLDEQLKYLKELKKQDDYIIQIDNTSISNRPDLFSHRGLAREISFLYNIELIKESEIIIEKTQYKKNISKNIFHNNSENVQAISAATLKFEEKESTLNLAIPLCHLDITPHSFLIDLSNYVMIDIGQPIHVFDKKNINGSLQFTENISGTIECLDHTTIKIDKNALIIENNNKIHSLVGIIGGKESSINKNTKEIIVESASINKKLIEKTMRLFCKKTESGIRNEKGSSPYAAEYAICRFLFLMKQYFDYNIEHIQFYIANTSHTVIDISADYIAKIIGISITKEKISIILDGLGFKINYKKNNHSEDTILIDVPWWRLDIHNKDDIAEEIVRHIGFNAIPLTPPTLFCKGDVIYNNIYTNLKKQTVISAHAQEVITYGIGNEASKKKWSFESYNQEINLINEYSTIQTSLISSHITSFLDIIYKEIKLGQSEITIFEINPIWINKDNKIKENKTYSIAFYNEKTTYNFHFYKNIIKTIFNSIDYQITWSNSKNSLPHNMYSEINAEIYHEDNCIGICGFLNPIKIYKEIKKNGSIFFVEINLKKLIEKKSISEKEKKHPHFDISLLIFKNIKAQSIIEQLNTAFGNIMGIDIIDWFESADWVEKRSITIRIYVLNIDINEQYNEIKNYLQTQGHIIR